MDDRMAAIGRLQKKVSGDKKPGSMAEAVGRAGNRALDGKKPGAPRRKGATGLRGANPVGTATSAARTAAKAAGRVASVGRPAPKGSASSAVLG